MLFTDIDFTILSTYSVQELNNTDQYGNSILMQLILYNPNYIMDLIEMKVDINIKNNDNYTALMLLLSISSWHTNPISITLLLEYPEIELNIFNKFNENALMIAIYTNNEEMIDYILSHHTIDINIVSPTGSNALIVAIEHNFYSAISIINNPKTNLKYISLSGNSILIMALLANNTKYKYPIIQQLLLHDIDINYINFENNTALIIAIVNKLDSICELLIFHSTFKDIQCNGITALMVACLHNSKIVELLSTKVDINLYNNQRETALFIAIRSDNIDCATLLLSNPLLNIKHTNNVGRNIAWLVSTDIYIDLFITILQKDRTLATQQDTLLYTILMIVCIDNEKLCFNYLLQSNVYEHYMDRDVHGKTAFMYCIQTNNVEMAQLLFMSDAQRSQHITINDVDNEGNTAIMLASIYGKMYAVQYIVTVYVDIIDYTIQNKYGNNIFMLCNEKKTLLLIIRESIQFSWVIQLNKKNESILFTVQDYDILNEISLILLFNYSKIEIVEFLNTINMDNKTIFDILFDTYIPTIHQMVYMNIIYNMFEQSMLHLVIRSSKYSYISKLYNKKNYDLQPFSIILSHLKHFSKHVDIAFSPTIRKQIQIINTFCQSNSRLNKKYYMTYVNQFNALATEDTYILSFFNETFLNISNIFYIVIILAINTGLQYEDLCIGLSPGDLIINSWLARINPIQIVSLYSIFLSPKFVATTQWKPKSINELTFFFKNDGLYIDKSDRPNVIFSCQNGHLHSVPNCGVPIDFMECGKTDDNNPDNPICTKIVGGSQHMLAPGCSIVYMNENAPYDVWSGYLPIYSYTLYSRLIIQYNIEVSRYNRRIRPFSHSVLHSIAVPIKSIFVSKLVSGSIKRYPCAFTFCDGDNIGYNDDGTIIDGTYVIHKCGHYLCIQCLSALRGHIDLLGNINIANVEEDINDDSLQKRECIQCLVDHEIHTLF